MSNAPCDIVIEATEQISAAGVGNSALLSREEAWPSVLEQPIQGVSSQFSFHHVTGWKQTPEVRQQDAYSLQTVACAKLLIDHGTTIPDAMRRRGIVLGSAYGSAESESQYMDQMAVEGPGGASPVKFRNAVSNAVLGHLAVAFRFGGSSSLVMSGALSGLYAMGITCQLLRLGLCDAAMTGVTELTSAVVRQRFNSRLSFNPTYAMPLMDGSCLVLLRRRRPEDQGYWSVGAQVYGRALGHQTRRTLRDAVDRALGRALLRLEDVELALVHTHRGAYFCNAATVIDASVESLDESPAWGRDPGTTALPLMLNLCLALSGTRSGKIPHLIGAAPNRIDGEPRAGRLLVVALDTTGAFSIAVFVRDLGSD